MPEEKLQLINHKQAMQIRVLFWLIGLVSLTGFGIAQVLRIERTNAPTADDFRPNDPLVPDAYSISAPFKRVVVVRLKHQTDLLEGLAQTIKRQKIRNGVVLAGIGSVTSSHYHVVSNRSFPTQNTFVKDPVGPADIISMNGYIIDGRVHVHVTFANATNAFGGHLEPGTTVFTFAIVTVGVFRDGTDLNRIDDKHYR